MPRNRDRVKTKKKTVLNNLEVAGDLDDRCSDVTQLSLDDDIQSGHGESIAESEIINADFTEDRFKEALENASDKNISIRFEALKSLQSMLESSYVPELLTNWKVTAADSVERCMKKKGTEECKKALDLGVLLALQLGSDFNGQITRFGPILRDWTADTTASAEFRAECASALGVYTFVTEDEIELLVSTLHLLEEIWSRFKTGSAVLYSSCIYSWAILLSRLSNRYLNAALSKNIPQLASFLESDQMEVRIASGEVLCVLYESAREVMICQQDQQNEFIPAVHQKILEILESLSKDSVKYQTKRDRRVQRATFRDIYSTIKNCDAPETKVKFGSEVLTLDSWSSRLCYNAFCGVLRGGINRHLRENVMLREIFNLGPPILNPVSNKMTKLERQLLNQNITKTRSLLRNKQRDKRHVVFS